MNRSRFGILTFVGFSLWSVVFVDGFESGDTSGWSL